MSNFDKTTKRMVKEAFRHGLEKDYVSEARLWREIADRLDERNEPNYKIFYFLGRAMMNVYENKLYEDGTDTEYLLRVARQGMRCSKLGYEVFKTGCLPFDKTSAGTEIERIFSKVDEDYQKWLRSDRMT